MPPDVDSWRSKLLLQVLRETGEEMKRRRQTLQEVLARHAAEAGGAGVGDSSLGAQHLGREGLRQPGSSGQVGVLVAYFGRAVYFFCLARCLRNYSTQ